MGIQKLYSLFIGLLGISITAALIVPSSTFNAKLAIDASNDLEPGLITAFTWTGTSVFAGNTTDRTTNVEMTLVQSQVDTTETSKLITVQLNSSVDGSLFDTSVTNAGFSVDSLDFTNDFVSCTYVYALTGPSATYVDSNVLVCTGSATSFGGSVTNSASNFYANLGNVYPTSISLQFTVVTYGLTTLPLTTQPLTTQPLTSGAVTSSPLTTQPLTTQPLTTSPLTTQPLTTKPLTTQPLSTSPLTTQPLTTKPLTTQPLSTSPLTTQPLTTKPLTTQPLTSGAVTSSPLTTQP
jgi:hypothetical protein